MWLRTKKRIPLDVVKQQQCETAVEFLNNPVETLEKYKLEKMVKNVDCGAETSHGDQQIKYGNMINCLHAIGKKWATTSVELVQELVYREGEDSLLRQEHSNRPVFNAVWGARR